MIKILVVEDEENIALALSTILEKGIEGCDVDSASNGIEALTLFNQHTYDLVLSDWNMPVMTGGELLYEIRSGEINQGVPFLMLTARADTDSVRGAINNHVTEYIVKPFEKESLIKKVRSNLDVTEKPVDASRQISDEQQSVFQDVMNLVSTRIKKGLLNFPVLSEVGMKIIDVVNASDSTLEDVIKIIKPDQSISGKILSVANSSFYRGQSSIETLESAVTRIGLKETGSIVVAYSLRELFNKDKSGFSKRFKVLWEHSLASAICAKQLGVYQKLNDVERLYIAAMFHDIGKLLLLQVLMELTTIRNDIDDQVIDSVLDALHINLGMKLLKHWKFSPYFVKAIKYHHDVDLVADYEPEFSCVILANQLSKVLNQDYLEDHLGAGVISQIASDMGLDRKDLGKILSDSRDSFIQMKTLFYPV